MNNDELPDELVLSRTTAVFDHDTVPPGLLAAHRVAEGVWGRLVVHSGVLTFVFEDEADEPRRVGAGGHVIIPPSRPHHLELTEPATFVVEFHRLPAERTSV